MSPQKRILRIRIDIHFRLPGPGAVERATAIARRKVNTQIILSSLEEGLNDKRGNEERQTDT